MFLSPGSRPGRRRPIIASPALALAGLSKSTLINPYDLRNCQGASVASFSAHKNGTDQAAFAPGAYNKITFGTEIYDAGGWYDTTNSRWTPPAGKISIKATVYFTSTTNDLTGYGYLGVYKNGAVFKQAGGACIPAGVSPTIAISDIEGNGSDYYEIYGFVQANTGNIVASGLSHVTYFMGEWTS